MAVRRIQRELAEMQTAPSDAFDAAPVRDDDLFVWDARLHGPPASPYAGGVFVVSLTFPRDYPFRPPKVAFVTKLFHPNVAEDGAICIGVLKPEVWKPSNKIVDIIQSLLLILEQPNADDAINGAVAEMMLSSKDRFEKTAKEWVKKYATAG
ncbi:hypothetical protein HDU84_005527 [Entophlyctis sp. JEL0112]|nr:hypothetical protein HDU84_005527 [Entophlyctis sp. JEL0112]